MIVILQLARRLSECVACPLHPFVLSLALYPFLSSALSLSFTPFRLCAFYVDTCLPIRPRNVELIKRANPLCEY